MSARLRTLTRCLRTIERLKVRRATLAELAQESGVSTRTVRRDLEALSAAGVPVHNTADAAANGYNGFWWVER
jgi:predicted DNA-binding transcriptional regulator YafY